MKYNVVIDGPNFISRLIDSGMDSEFITKYFSLNQFLNMAIKHTIRNEFGSVISLGIEFNCTLKLLCPESNNTLPFSVSIQNATPCSVSN